MSDGQTNRLLLLGLDGLSWPLLEPLLAAGVMPTLAQLRREGAWGPLTSVVPTQSAAAWATFLTGQNPARHGVVDFTVRQTDGSYRHAKPHPASTFWHHLAQAGLRVGVLNFPVTYPPDPVPEGSFLVSGMLSPQGRTFSHPPALGAELLAAVPGYRLDVEWQLYAGRPEALLDDLTDMTRQRAQAAVYLRDRYDPDCLAVAFVAPDRLLHALWADLDATHPRHDADRGAALRPRIHAFFGALDEAVGALVSAVGGAMVLVVSDHGFQAAAWQFRVDDWLAGQGWLVRGATRSRLERWARRLDRPGVRRVRKRLIKDVSRHLTTFAPGGTLDWPRTVAFSPWNVQQGIRLNVRGREPQGTVEPGGAYEALRDEIRQALRAAVEPRGGQGVVDRVWRREENLCRSPFLFDARPGLYPAAWVCQQPHAAGALGRHGLGDGRPRPGGPRAGPGTERRTRLPRRRGPGRRGAHGALFAGPAGAGRDGRAGVGRRAGPGAGGGSARAPRGRGWSDACCASRRRGAEPRRRGRAVRPIAGIGLPVTRRELVQQLRDPANRTWIVVGLAVFGLAGVAAFVLSPWIYLALLGGGAVVLAWLVAPEAVIVGLLLARSSIDGFMEVFTLFAGSALSMNLAGAVNSLAVGLGVLTLVRRLVRRQPLLVSAPGRTFGLFLLVALLSILGAVDPFAGVKEWARLGSGLAIYLMVADGVRDERGARRFVAALMASSLVPLAVAWLQRLVGSGYFFLGFVGTEFAYRPQGTFAHPAALGSYLIIVLMLAVALYFSAPAEQSRVWKALLLGWAAVAGGCLVLTLARTQWLGLLVAALVVGLLKRRRLALLALAVAAILLATVPFLQERLLESHSIGWRVELWQAAVQLLSPPMLQPASLQAFLGRGLASSPWHINRLLPKVYAPPHNDYLKAAIEMGLVGLLAYLSWLLALVRHAWRAYRDAESPALAWRAVALLAVAVSAVVMSASDNYLGYTAVQWYLWALVALVPVAGRWR